MTDTAPDIKAIFVEALDLASDAERAAYLERVCEGLPDVRVRVEALLAAIGQAGSFLEAPALDREGRRGPGAGVGSTTLAFDADAGAPTADPRLPRPRRGSATSSWSGGWVRGRWGSCSRRGR